MPKIDDPIKEESTGLEVPKTESKKKKKRGRPILFLIIVVVVIVVGGYLITRFVSGGSLGGGRDYQAIFLINGQVYFGHVAKETKDQVVLKDIYYLRVTEPLQQAQEAGGQKSSELSLIKLGNELHGPKDEMRIVRNNVLFIEDLKDDSKVTIAIEEYIADQED